MKRFAWGDLLMAPPGDANPHFGTPDEGTPALFADETWPTPAEEDDREPLPPYMAQLFEVAGVPATLDNGQTLYWSNAACTSSRFSQAQVHIEPLGAWVEFTLVWSNSRRQRMRTTRYLDVVALEDSLGLDGAEPVTLASGRLLVDFRAAVAELMVRH